MQEKSHLDNENPYEVRDGDARAASTMSYRTEKQLLNLFEGRC